MSERMRLFVEECELLIRLLDRLWEDDSLVNSERRDIKITRGVLCRQIRTANPAKPPPAKKHKKPEVDPTIFVSNYTTLKQESDSYDTDTSTGRRV